MDCRIIVVSSITYAFKAKDILDSRGINSKVEKIKKVAALNGCGYGLRIAENNVKNAVRFLNYSGIKTVDIIECEGKTR